MDKWISERDTKVGGLEIITGGVTSVTLGEL
jgi:hypothetical protein